MTEENKQLIIDKFKNNRKGFYCWLLNKKRQYLIDDLRLQYPDADSDLERVYWLVFNLTSAPLCPVCGRKIPFYGGRSLNKNGYNNHCSHECGTKDPKHQERIKATKEKIYGDPNYNNKEKGRETCKLKYGGNGIRGNREKAKKTMLERYGVEYYLNSREINAMRDNKDIQEKIQDSKRKNKTFNTSKPESDFYVYLCNIYGKSNVIRQYKDNERYPFNCDFYIKSEDLFIEVNLFPTHYKEPFNEKNKEHLEYLQHCKTEPKNWVEEQIPLIWAGTDILKKQLAEKNNLKYKQIYDLKEICNEKYKSKR
jgi:hypothetical protein